MSRSHLRRSSIAPQVHAWLGKKQGTRRKPGPRGRAFVLLPELWTALSAFGHAGWLLRGDQLAFRAHFARLRRRQNRRASTSESWPGSGARAGNVHRITTFHRLLIPTRREHADCRISLPRGLFLYFS